jgi:DNA repair protein RadC
MNIIEKALNQIRSENRAFYDAQALTCVDDSKNYVELLLTDNKQEHFAVLFLSNSHTLIKSEILFNGTIDSASVYPRIIAQKCLEYGASAVILAHNHPSGSTIPSAADIAITKRISKSLELFDIRVLDHLIVGSNVVSLAQKGMM